AQVVAQWIVVVEDSALLGERELRPARHPRAYGEDAAVVLAVECDEALVLRPWAHEAHLADQDLPELGDLVDLQPGQQGADAGEAVVVVGSELQAARVVAHLPE